MRDKEEFFNLLNTVDGKDFEEYSRLIGDFDFSRYVLKINRVQHSGDDRPTLFVVRVPQIIAGFPDDLFNAPVRRTALEDFLTRRVTEQLEGLAHYDEQGISRRRLFIASPGQKIIPRSSMVVTDEYVEARISVDLPARRGRIAADSAKDVFFEDLPSVINASLIYCNLDDVEIRKFVDVMEDADQVRQLLPTRGLIGFLEEGAALRRQAGDDTPAAKQHPLRVTDSVATDMEVPNQESLRGLGIPSGVTVILGDAYSGRVELMQALAAGIYNHIPGDGREGVVTVPDAVAVAAEPGRSIQRVDISSFVHEGMNTSDWKAYSSPGADACASQAAATVEALEIGARVLLFDEADSSAAFLSEDSRLTNLMAHSTGVIPLCVRARQIVDELGVSVVVAGSAAVAEFIPLADTVLRVDDFEVTDVTEEAKSLQVPSSAAADEAAQISALVEESRWIIPSSIDPSAGLDDAYIDAPAVDVLQFGRSVISLRGVKQLADVYQTATIGLILYYARLRYMDEGRPIREVLDLVDRDLSTEGLECLSRELRGDLARPRRYEIAAALNRLSSLRISQAEDA